MAAMLSPRSDRVRRRWFADARDGARRMELSWHPDERLVIASLWHGDVCRATFRLPVEEAGTVIGVLADALGDEARRRVDELPTATAVPARRFLARLRGRLRGNLAEIVTLTRHGPPTATGGPGATGAATAPGGTDGDGAR